MKKLTSLTIALVLLLNLSACGTLFYPERVGQRHSNEVDIKVAVADGIGLLFFIVPGIIAFAVDYNNGSIYLPSRHSSIDHSVKVVSADRDIDNDYLEAMLEEEFDIQVDLDASSTLIDNNRSLDAVRLLKPDAQSIAFNDFNPSAR